MKSDWRQAKAKLCAAAAFCGSIGGCGGGGDSEAPSPPTTAAAPTPAPTPSTPPVAPQCTAPLPVCTVTASPRSSRSDPLLSGTEITLAATCDSQPDSATWLVNTARFASGLTAKSTPTAGPNSAVTYEYRFEYQNCAGKGSADVQAVVTDVILELRNARFSVSVNANGDIVMIGLNWDSNIPATSQLSIVDTTTGVEELTPLDSRLTIWHGGTLDVAGHVRGRQYALQGISTDANGIVKRTAILTTQVPL